MAVRLVLPVRSALGKAGYRFFTVMLERPFLRAWKTMELPGESFAGEEQPQCVSRSKENRRVRKRRQSRPEAAAATIPNATGCCQSIHAQHTSHRSWRNREFMGNGSS